MPKEFVDSDFESAEDVLKGAISRYLPYWPIFALAIFCTAISGIVYLKYAIPIFETSARILVKDDKKGLDESKILESLDLFESKKIVENEIEVIKSVQLVSHVVRNLYLYAPIFEKREIFDASAYRSSPVTVEFKNPDSIVYSKTKQKFLFEFNDSLNVVSFQGHQFPIGTWLRIGNGTFRFIKNANYDGVGRNKRFYFELLSVYEVSIDLLDRIEVESVSKLASIINLRLKDAETARAENILDELIKQYNKAGVYDKNTLAANTLAFVQSRLDPIISDLDSIENQIKTYRKTHRIVDISEQSKVFLEASEKNNDLITQNAVQKSVLDQIDAYLTGNGKSISTLGTTDPVLGDLVSQLSDLETKYEAMKTTTGEANPALVTLEREIASIRQKLRDNVKSQRRNLAEGNRTVNDVQKRYNSMLNNIPQQERDLVEISREQSIKNSIYAFLLQKREETDLSLASTVPDSRIVDKAHSTIKPVQPNIFLVIGSALLLGILIGVLFVNVKEVFNRHVLFRTEIESMVKIPVVGEINYEPSKKQIVVGEGQRGFVAEQFRQLRTSLSYLGVSRENNKILVTSTISGEGKSFISANLGISLALGDKNVVILELDLRKPKLSEIFGLSRTNGITNFLIGKASIEKIITPTSILPNLFVIPSGPLPPNPSELIMNAKLAQLIAYLKDTFDYVVIDSAPTNPVTDAYLLSPLCDATLYVVRHRITPKSALRSFEANNRIRPLKNVAIVFNGVHSRGFGNEYGYGYGDSGSYGKSYGYNSGRVESAAD